MNKIFGYTENNGNDWFVSAPYHDREIERIKDPQGGNVISLSTAIPSPFARIDMVKTAFKNISQTPNLKEYKLGGNVLASREDEKLVSDSLDLSELIFNIDNISELRIITWDKNTSLNALKNRSLKQKRFADTLELYLEQDKESYNFSLVRRIYLFEYKHKIIGGTSPVTLVFPSANDLSFAQMKLTTNDTLFDDKYSPLYSRDSEFQKYIYLLFKAYPILTEKMSGFSEYLRKNLEILDSVNHKLYEEIHSLRIENFISDYSELDTGLKGDVIDVIIGVNLKKRKKTDFISAASNSDFVISSSKYDGKSRPLPLVLQNNFNKALRYVNDLWDNNTKVPYYDKETVLEKRSLPEIKIPYPYLTVSDFLEPKIIRLVYPINKDYFDGNLKIEFGNDSKGYLLPLKPLFFEFFDVEDLTGGTVKFEIIQRTGEAVKVILQIPIKKQGEYITFERIYYPDPDEDIREENNKGEIIEQQFGITLFPFIKINNPEIAPFYRVQLIDRNISGKLKNTFYNLDFYSNNSNNAIEIKAKAKRSQKTASDAASQYYVLEKQFDFIQVRNDLANGIIIPLWKVYQAGNEEYSFAIDFGTTNTHIEYRIGTSSPKPFDITSQDVQIATLFDPIKTSESFGGTDAIDIRDLIEHEFLPHRLGKDADYKFPHRTVLSESYTLNIDTETNTLADFNIPFVYGRKVDKGKVHSELKWAKKEKGNEKRIGAFFEKLIMLMRNKVLFGGGDLNRTELIWFYPSSMKRGRKSDLENEWNRLFEKYFHSQNKPVGITESLAPFFYFKGAGKLPGGSSYRPVVSIDIGGGTSDIVVFQKNIPLFLTSFKFAANTLFGDGYSEFGSLKANGIANKYYYHFKNLFEQNKLYDLSKVLDHLTSNKAADINTFFFSIENNPRVNDQGLFSFNSALKNDENFKIIFLYFYSAIIYHIAQLMKYRKVDLPKHIIFSGTGSKILSIISSDNKLLAEFSRMIFESVYGIPYDSDGLNITIEKDMPKEVTCKGGLMCNHADLTLNTNNIKEVFSGVAGIESLCYSNLNEINKNQIAVSVEDFNKLFLSLDKKMKFIDDFNVSSKSFTIFKSSFNKNIRDYLEEGIEYNKKLDDNSASDKEIEESLFFYPLVGIINNLTKELAD